MNSIINKIITKYMNPNYKSKRRKKEKRGYIEIFGYGFRDLALEGIMTTIGFSIFMCVVEFILWGTISDIKFPLLLIAILGFLFVLFYIYYSLKIIWFNDEEIIVFKLIRKNKVYKYEDIIKVNDIKKHKIIIHTTKGKIKVDHELHNSKKILAKLKEKNIPIKEVLIFEKMFPNAKI